MIEALSVPGNLTAEKKSSTFDCGGSGVQRASLSKLERDMTWRTVRRQTTAGWAGCAKVAPAFILHSFCYCIRRSPSSTIVLQDAGCGTVTYHLLYLVEPIAQRHAVCPDDGLGADGDGITVAKGRTSLGTFDIAPLRNRLLRKQDLPCMTRMTCTAADDAPARPTELKAPARPSVSDRGGRTGRSSQILWRSGKLRARCPLRFVPATLLPCQPSHLHHRHHHHRNHTYCAVYLYSLHRFLPHRIVPLRVNARNAIPHYG